jgi:enediyne biosynthesis protein E4
MPAAIATSGFSGQPGWPIPLTSRSEVVQTIQAGVDGYGLMLRSASFAKLSDLEFLAIPHAQDEQVLVVDGELMIVGAPTLVSADTALARQDGLLGPAAKSELAPPAEGQVTLALSGQAQTRIARTLTSRSLMPYTFDQVFAAPVRPALREADLGRAILVSAELIDFATEQPLAVKGPWQSLAGPLEFEVAQRQTIAGARDELSEVVIGRGRALVAHLDLPMVRKDTQARAWTLVVHTLNQPAEVEPFVGAPWHVLDAPTEAAPERFIDVMGRVAGDMMHLEGPADQRDIRPTMGPGVAVGDVNNDGRLDLFLPQGAGRPELRTLTARLYLMRENAADPAPATESIAQPLAYQWVSNTGLEIPAAGMGALLFDADGDGDLDVYQANYGKDFLFENRWNARKNSEEPFLRLRDVAYAGDQTIGWSAGLAAGDIDLDGDLDLYVTTYLVYDEAAMPDDGELSRYQREDPIAMLPFAFPGGRNLMLINESDTSIQFRDATDELGLADEQGRGMQPVFWDFDEDGDVDLYVANDVSMNRLWRNETLGPDGLEGARGVGFKDVSFSTGMDDPRGGMGVDIGDVDGDGDQDLMLTNWQLEPNALYLSRRAERFAADLHRSTFKDAIVESGLGTSGVGTTSWGGVLFDADNDTDLDLFVSNGYTSPDYRTTGICVGQPNQYFVNDGGGHFTDASASAGVAVTRPLPSRAAVAADLDRDGDLDLVVTTNNGPVQLLQNTWRETQPKAGHFVIVQLSSSTKNRFGIGARVTVVTLNAKGEEQRQTRSLLAGQNYLAGNPPELYFGLGSASKVVRYEVQWPSTKRMVVPGGAVDRIVTLYELP